MATVRGLKQAATVDGTVDSGDCHCNHRDRKYTGQFSRVVRAPTKCTLRVVPPAQATVGSLGGTTHVLPMRLPAACREAHARR